MNRWLTLATAGVVALSLSAPVFTGQAEAQAPTAKTAKGAAKGKAGRGRLQAALAKLNLTPEQKTKIQAIMADSRAQVKQATQGITDPKAKRKAARPINQAARQKVLVVLTAAQKKQLQEELAKSRPAGKKAGTRAKSKT